jgi:predicted transcriptional regulator
MGSKEELIELLQKNGVKRTTSYSTLDRLIKLGLIIERDGLYRISGKAKIYITLI